MISMEALSSHQISSSVCSCVVQGCIADECRNLMARHSIRAEYYFMDI
jgi:hypothetical protein